jgi:hypothetical protein
MFMLSMLYYFMFSGFKSQTHRAVKFFLLIFVSNLTMSIYFSRNMWLISLRNFFTLTFFIFYCPVNTKGINRLKIPYFTVLVYCVMGSVESVEIWYIL